MRVTASPKRLSRSMVVTACAIRPLRPSTIPVLASVRPWRPSTPDEKPKKPAVVVARADGTAVAQTCWCSKRPVIGLPTGKEPWSISWPCSAPASPVDTDSVDVNGNAVLGPLPPPGLGGAGAPPPPPPPPPPGGWAPPPQSPSAPFCDRGFTPPL